MDRIQMQILTKLTLAGILSVQDRVIEAGDLLIAAARVAPETEQGPLLDMDHVRGCILSFQEAMEHLVKLPNEGIISEDVRDEVHQALETSLTLIRQNTARALEELDA